MMPVGSCIRDRISIVLAILSILMNFKLFYQHGTSFLCELKLHSRIIKYGFVDIITSKFSSSLLKAFTIMTRLNKMKEGCIFFYLLVLFQSQCALANAEYVINLNGGSP